MHSDRKFLPDYAFAVLEEFQDSMRSAKFYPGDIFYDHPTAYSGPWVSSLQATKRAIQIIDVYGLKVKVKILMTNPEKTGMCLIEEISVTPEDLVALLKNGYKGTSRAENNER